MESLCTSVKNDLSSAPVVLCASSHSIRSNGSLKALRTTDSEWYVENTTVSASAGLFSRYPARASASVETGDSSSVMEPSSPVLLSEHTAR